VNERGEFNDVPLDDMLATFSAKYPSLSFSEDDSASGFGDDASFERDVEAEVSSPK
jgi:hypothetical protein